MQSVKQVAFVVDVETQAGSINRRFRGETGRGGVGTAGIADAASPVCQLVRCYSSNIQVSYRLKIVI